MAKTKEIHHIIQMLDEHIHSIEAIKLSLVDLFNCDSAKKVTVELEDVRAVLADKSRLGFTKEIKQIITKLGATKLSEVDKKDYAILLKKAEGLGNE